MQVTKHTTVRYTVVYNNEECILDTEKVNKALKMAETCAKCAEHPCTYDVYCKSICSSIRIATYEVTE